MTLDTGDVKALGPSLQNTFVDIVLRSGIREGKAEGKLVKLAELAVVGLKELHQAIGDVLPELVGLSSLELLWHPILGLDDVEL